MTDFSKVLEQAKNMQNKMKETQESIKKIEVEGVAGGGSIKIYLNGDGELIKLHMAPEIMKESKEILEDLIIAAHGDAKKKIKIKFLKINYQKMKQNLMQADLNKIKNCIKITGFVNSTDDFFDQPKVINPASETLSFVFGDKGKHTRAAVSTNSLPLGVAVEVDAIFELN